MTHHPLTPLRARTHSGEERSASQRRALLAAHYTEFLLDAARRQGVDRAQLFGDEPVFATRGRRALWSHEDLGLVSMNLRQATGDELWGLAPGARIPLGTFRFACELFPLSATLGEALTRAFRLYDLMGSLRFELSLVGNVARIAVIPPPMSAAGAAFVTEWWTWVWHYVSQWFVRSEIPLPKVEFPHHPRVAADIYHATFGSRCVFGAETAGMSFARQDLSRPVTRSLDEIPGFFRANTIGLEYFPDIERSVTTSVRIALLSRLQGENAMPTLEELAQDQGVTGQTLRRWLVAEGASYRQLKAEVRSLVARQQLARPDATLSEVATRAGFAETSAFTRAFRAWTGMNVSQFRQSLAGGEPGDGKPKA